MTIVAAIQFDGGDEVKNDNFELGVFVQGTETCRATKFPPQHHASGHYVYRLTVKGQAGETYTFRVYDHATDTEYTDVDESNHPTFVMQTTIGANANPYMVNFITPVTPGEPTVLEGGDWSQDSTWVGNVPEEWADVIINGDVFIPAGYIAYANNITINEGGSLTINEGGQLFHNEVVEVTMEQNIAGYQDTRDENPDNDGYRLIASPVYESSNNPRIAIPEAMLEGNYDLYYFDQTQDLEWINHKLGNDQYQFTTLDLGKGYLYANTANVFVAFVGQTTPTNFPIGLDMVYEPGHVFTGWNLLGNPYTATAYADRAYYVLDAEGDDVISAELGEGIAPMKGFFVEAGSAEDLTCTVSTTPQNNNTGSLNINLSQANTLADRAIVNFGEGKTLGKFQLNPNHTKVFIPQEGKDYAVVSAGDKGEMPVSFKAEKSGTYTMSLSSQNVSFSYLHLIDNKTGQDIDMLATPAYTFNAQTTDYASRFRLVFATDNSVNSDSFGFVNNSGNFCVYGIEGEATLQVFDVLGHMLSSETFSGSIEKKVNAATGVYMMRLINGNDVKVQKVIIK